MPSTYRKLLFASAGEEKERKTYAGVGWTAAGIPLDTTWIIKRTAAQQGCFDEASTQRKIAKSMLMRMVT